MQNYVGKLLIYESNIYMEDCVVLYVKVNV